MKVPKRFKALLVVLIAFFAFTLFVSLKPVYAEDPLVLKVGIWAPARSGFVKGLAWIFPQVEERSKGRIKFKMYYSGTLVPVRETLSALRSGVADIATTAASLHPGKLPLATVTTLPLLQKRFYMTARASRELFLTVPEVRDELARYNTRYLTHAQNSSYGLWTNFPVRSIADIKGKKIGATGMNANLMKALGAVPVTVAATETYTALERKTIDGAMANPTYGATYKFDVVCPYYYNYPFGCGLPFVGININSWNKIPADIQQMFADLEDEAVRYAYEVYTGRGRKVLAEGKASGNLTITEPSAEDAAFIKKVAQEQVWKEWVDNMNKKGLPGQKVLDAYSALLDKWEARDPFK